MSRHQNPDDSDNAQRIVTEARRERDRRMKTYRDRALQLFPWVCGRCGREFSGKRLKELTVHHKDHNHDHNPPDGSNWELLCLYCHENEHARQAVADGYDRSVSEDDPPPVSGHRPFAGLAELLQKRSKP
ncbi:MAG: YajD family HNH nuclease [Desulfobacteraceae bacterium]|jgi:hypothetical protein|nr:YajD family HNH nuclease [Desulfobacteraceae bacterium]